MGSMAVAGLLPQTIIKEKDNEGVSVDDAIEQFGGVPRHILDAKRPNSDFVSFFELHIEQSQTLEEENKSVGIVLGIAGPYQLS